MHERPLANNSKKRRFSRETARCCSPYGKSVRWIPTVDHGGELVREGGNHSWWGNTALNQRSAVPRHREIPDNLVKKICRDLGIPAPGESEEKGEASDAADSL